MSVDDICRMLYVGLLESGDSEKAVDPVDRLGDNRDVLWDILAGNLMALSFLGDGIWKQCDGHTSDSIRVDGHICYVGGYSTWKCLSKER